MEPTITAYQCYAYVSLGFVIGFMTNSLIDKLVKWLIDRVEQR